jgi:hypothetical protein
MATINKQPLVCNQTLHGGPPITRTYPEAASQTFLKGEAVYIDGSGNVAEYNVSIDDGTQRFLGFAAEDGHNDTVAATNRVAVYLPWGNVCEANVCTGAGNDQITAKTQVANAGTSYALFENATLGIVQVDIGNTGGQIRAATIIEIVGTVGDTNGRVRFMLVPASTQLTGAA